jgi:predicted glycosyltransferase
VSLALGFETVLDIRQELIRTAALRFEPDVLLVDHMPHGSMGELVPTLEALADTPTRKVLGLRDILDDPGTVRRRWTLEGAFSAVERHFDQVLVYGSRDVFDVAAEYRWPAHLAQRMHYCGYVCARTPGPFTALRRRYLHGREVGTKLILAMAGGGADAFPLFDAILAALPTILTHRLCRLVLVTGPFLPRDQLAALRRRARDLPVKLLSTVSDSLSHMAAADLVVTMAGYNTTAELLRVGTPGLLVPRAGPSAEQQMRASLLAQRGWLNWLPPASLSTDSMATAVLAGLEPPIGPPPTPPDLGGLERAARQLTGDADARSTHVDETLHAVLDQAASGMSIPAVELP